MSLKLIIVCASLAVVSAARFDHEQLNQQLQQQQQIALEQSERIRDHRRNELEQRQDQLRNLEEQQRRQEQMHRDHEQQRRENEQQRREQEHQRRENHHNNVHAIGNVIIAAQPHQLVPGQVHYIAVPSSHRSFNQYDNSNYNFAYAISDLTTGDVKSQHETRRGDQVQGSYTMMDSDGYQRTVEYRADDQNGFDAEVRREPVAVVAPQLVRVDNYAPQFYHHQQVPQLIAASRQPTIYSSTSVSRRDDGQRNQYTSTTASNF